MSDYVVGLTGGIGSGKTTVADLFVERGAALVDTDAIAHELTGPDGAAMPALIAEFGPGIAQTNGALDRAAMRRLAFDDATARGRLEGILHPEIRRIAGERCRAAGAPYVILAVPLLVEAGGYRDRCDRIVVVDCPEALQLQRVMARNTLSAEEVGKIIASQASRTRRQVAADDIVLNDGLPGALVPSVDFLHEKYLRLSAEKLKASC